MASLDVAEEPEGRIRLFQRTDLGDIPGGQASPDFPFLVAALSELEEEEGAGEGEAYHTDEPPLPAEISFPNLLSGREELSLAREELELEIGLILEMRTEGDFDTGAALYSVTSLRPLPVALSDDDLKELSDLPGPAKSNARAGYLIYEDLYALQSDPNRLHDLVSVFLERCEEVEIKLKRRDDATWQTVKVCLAS